eukprot:scaffold818_cov61-Attheya_sp.AAC.1
MSKDPCSISFYKGQTLDLVVTDDSEKLEFAYSVIEFGMPDSKWLQFQSDGKTTLIGGYQSIDLSENTASYSDGTNCGAIKGPRSGTVVVDASSSATFTTYSVKEPNTCVYEFVIQVPAAECHSGMPAKKSKCSKSSKGSTTTNMRGLKIKSCY